MANTEIFLRNIFGTTRPNIRPLVLALNITNDLLFEQHISMSDIKATKHIYIKRGSDSYVAWNYNSSFNQNAVAFNDEFIDVSVGSTEKADISYKGRDNNSKLIVT